MRPSFFILTLIWNFWELALLIIGISILVAISYLARVQVRKKEAQRTQQQAYAELEQRVADRTAELSATNAQLIEKNRLIHALHEIGQRVQASLDRFDTKYDPPNSRSGKVAYFIPIRREQTVLAILATGSYQNEKSAIATIVLPLESGAQPEAV